MRRFESIIQSETAPNTSSLWLKDKKIWYFEGGWSPIEGAFDIEENKGLDEITKFFIGNKKFGDKDSEDTVKAESLIEELEVNMDPETWRNFFPPKGEGFMYSLLHALEVSKGFIPLYDKIRFTEYIPNNRAFLYHIKSNYDPLNDYLPCYFSYYPNIKTAPSVYHNGQIYSLLANKFEIYNVNINENDQRNYGRITKMKSIDLTLLPTYIDLELGNTDSVKAYNLEQLQKVSGTQFFVHADFGIGVGSFNSGHGGETTIQTAGGDRVHYLITAEGECKKQEDRFEHSELFFNLGQVDITSLPRTITIRDSVEIAKFRKATNLAFEVNNSGSFIDDVSMSQVSVNALTKQRLYTSPDIICVDEQDWNYIKATATTFNDRIEVTLETL